VIKVIKAQQGPEVSIGSFPANPHDFTAEAHEIDDGLQQLKCPDEYSTEVWDGLLLKEQVALYDDDDAHEVAASAAASTGGVGGGGFRAGCGAVGGASIPMSRSDSRSTKRVTAPLADSLAAAGAPGASSFRPQGEGLLQAIGCGSRVSFHHQRHLSSVLRPASFCLRLIYAEREKAATSTLLPPSYFALYSAPQNSPGIILKYLFIIMMLHRLGHHHRLS